MKKRPDATRDLIKYLTGPAAISAIKSQGLAHERNYALGVGASGIRMFAQELPATPDVSNMRRSNPV